MTGLVDAKLHTKCEVSIFSRCHVYPLGVILCYELVNPSCRATFACYQMCWHLVSAAAVLLIITQRQHCTLCVWRLECWTEYRNTRVLGARSRSSTTLDSCKAECVNDDDCTGLDWASSSSTPCWVHGTWSSGYSRHQWNGVNHYQLNRGNCPDPPGILHTV